MALPGYFTLLGTILSFLWWIGECVAWIRIPLMGQEHLFIFDHSFITDGNWKINTKYYNTHVKTLIGIVIYLQTP